MTGDTAIRRRRADGLSYEEGEVMDCILDAVACWDKLPVQHPDDRVEFLDAVHRIQDLLAVRIARRSYPEGWPSDA